jgi:DNA uptake protein ComE-like DNA-binding protein
MLRASFRTIAFALGVGTLLSAGALHAQVGKSVTIVDANAASEKDLLAIPGLNEALVKQIVAKRPFNSVTELDAILAPTLSKEQRAEVYKKAFVHVNLNKATKDEILLIPGVGNRMLHEFEEYRPYKSLAQFHREIGKYVKPDELARLEQYVFVPINLNTASDADILTIPGLGQRMLHEFKEYRPYKEMAQFRREIGKYVNAKEVARFERFVTIE